MVGGVVRAAPSSPLLAMSDLGAGPGGGLHREALNLTVPARQKFTALTADASSLYLG